MGAILKVTRKPFIALLVAALLTVLPLQGATFAKDGEDCPCCTVPEEILGATITELTGSEANVAIAQALTSEEVRILRLALLDAGYTPRVDQAKAASAVWDDEEGTHQGWAVVIPFEGEGLGASITYGQIDGQEQAIGAVVVDVEHMEVYSVVGGEVLRTVLNPCTSACVSNCLAGGDCRGLAWTLCITQCILAFFGCVPCAFTCAVCAGWCTGEVLGCVAACCL